MSYCLDRLFYKSLILPARTPLCRRELDLCVPYRMTFRSVALELHASCSLLDFNTFYMNSGHLKLLKMGYRHRLPLINAPLAAIPSHPGIPHGVPSALGCELRKRQGIRCLLEWDKDITFDQDLRVCIFISDIVPEKHRAFIWESVL